MSVPISALSAIFAVQCIWALNNDHPNRRMATFAHRRVPHGSVDWSRTVVPVVRCPPRARNTCLHQEGISLLETIAQDQHGTLHRARDKRRAVGLGPGVEKSGKRHGVHRFLEASEGADLAQTSGDRARYCNWSRDARSGLVIAVVSEYVSDPSLPQWIKQTGLPDPREAARLVLIIAEALEHGSRQLLVHGNLMADTIRIGDDGMPRITDFGLSRSNVFR